MLWSSSSSIHSGGTPASRVAASRALSSGIFPSAIAAATRTNAAVFASSGGADAALIVLLPAPCSPILSLLQSPFNAQLAHRLPPRVYVGPGDERRRPRPQPQLLQHRRQRQRRGDPVPVGDLERHPQSLLQQHRAVH